nr:hypothetical protein [Brachybacterium equifaecis]
MDREVADELRALSKDTADRTARHLVMAVSLMDEDRDQALAHARYAASIGGRIAVTRETYGVAAYQVGDYKTTVRELRTAMRISGRTDLLPMLADAERGLGRPERAFEIAASPEAEKLSVESTIELMIVVAGAYADTGDTETALQTLEIPALRSKVDGKWPVRLWAAYADLLETAGRAEESRRWLTLAADADTERLTDAAARLGRPAPEVEADPTWYDDEEVEVLDVFEEYADLDDEDPASADGTEVDAGATSAADSEELDDIDAADDDHRAEGEDLSEAPVTADLGEESTDGEEAR